MDGGLFEPISELCPLDKTNCRVWLLVVEKVDNFLRTQRRVLSIAEDALQIEVCGESGGLC